MPTYRIDLAYDGGAFHGYARQPGVATVQGDLEAALAPRIGPVETFVAGRTDKGVHASGQVASFESDAEIDTAALMRSLNKQLSPGVALLALTQVEDGFHARHSATGRRYRYLILNRAAPDPFLAATSWHLTHPLDLDAMNRAAEPLIGEQDFASLCRKAEGRSTVRDLRSASWRRDDKAVPMSTLGPSELLAFDVVASSFCHQMVRSIVAICVDVGRGAIDADEIPGILAARDRNAGRGAAPAHGLTLVAVEY